MRSKWTYNRETRQLEPFVEKPKAVDAPWVQPDEVAPFENPVTGEMETSMRSYRRKLKNLGYFEKGNERLKYELPSREARSAEIREDVKEAARQIKYGVAKCSPLQRQVWDLQNQGRDSEARAVWEKAKQG